MSVDGKSHSLSLMNFARNDIRDLRSGVKMGRIPKLVKERALREQREQQLKEEAERTGTSDRTGEVHAREASCSSTSDGSIENYDPDTMPAGNRARAIELRTGSTRRFLLLLG